MSRMSTIQLSINSQFYFSIINPASNILFYNVQNKILIPLLLVVNYSIVNSLYKIFVGESFPLTHHYF